MLDRPRLAGLLALALLALTAAPAAASPYPIGACVHVPQVHGRPLCVLVDPTE
jgi:hypothetical protein